MMQRPWRIETIKVDVVVYPNGKAVYEDKEYDSFDAAKEEVRSQYPLKAGRTIIINALRAKGNCTFCERELADEIEYILYEHERRQKHILRLVEKALQYYGDMLGEFAEAHHADNGGALGMVEGRFEMPACEIRSAMFESLYAAWGMEYADDHEDAVRYWETDYMAGMFRHG